MSDDPDRYFDFGTPGAQEWWYFDALSDDGRDALVVVWYAGLPFDPAYGVGTLRHLRDPGRPAPHALDHCAIGLSWYRDGRPAAYALNAFRRSAFDHRAEPFAVEVAGNRLDRDDRGYRLRVATPAVDGRTELAAALRFDPVAGGAPVERDLGGPGSPHRWILAAADCRVEGRLAVRGRRPQTLEFRGRGYHDHNAGSEEISVAMRRWRWGRVHHGDATEVYYEAEPSAGAAQSLWITCHAGRPEAVRAGVRVEEGQPRRNVFGVRDSDPLTLAEGPEQLRRQLGACVDDGPFYRRWLADFDRDGRPLGRGVAEVLATGNLHRPWFNWMIPYRLKRPIPAAENSLGRDHAGT